jgi:hypothetical protein
LRSFVPGFPSIALPARSCIIPENLFNLRGYKENCSQMTIASAIEELKKQRRRLDEAIAALEGLPTNSSVKRRGKMSAAGRAAVARAQRERWRKLKAKQKA